MSQNRQNTDLWSLRHWHTAGGKGTLWTLADDDFPGALRAQRFIAPLTIDGPINGDLFRARVQQYLVPELKPGDLVVMDNLSSHQVKGVREAIEAAGAQLRYLLPYSPDLNPIELLPDSGHSVPRSSISSPKTSAEIISNTADTATPDMKPL